MTIGDEIVLKGKIKDNAKVFSVNFVKDYNNIPYHFKTDFDKNVVIQNYKTDGQWREEIFETNTWIQGAGAEFVIGFYFDSSEFIVYGGDEKENFQYRFPYQFDIGDITSVQAWGDFEYINELTFCYGKK